MSGPETFVERVGDDALWPLAAAGDFASIGPNEPATHGWMVAVRARGPGYSTRVRLLAVESGRSVLRAANPGPPETIAVIRAKETMMRAVVVFVGRAVCEAQRADAPSLPFRCPEAAEVDFRGLLPGGGVR